MNIYIIRHAETARNREKVLQGRSNAPLNEAGEEQARKTGAFFMELGVSFDRIYTSPLTRCVQTARIIALAADGKSEGNNTDRNGNYVDNSRSIGTDAAGVDRSSGNEIENAAGVQKPADVQKPAGVQKPADVQKRIMIDERLLEMDYGPYEGVSLENPPPEIIHFFSDFVHNKEPEGMESLESVKERMRGFLDFIRQQPCDNVMIATHAIAMKGALEVLTPGSEGSYWSKYIGNCSVYHTRLENGIFRVPEEILTMSHEVGV